MAHAVRLLLFLLKFPFCAFMYFEKRLEHLLINLNEIKENIIIPLMILRWPRGFWFSANFMTIIRLFIGLAVLYPIARIWGFEGNYLILVFLGIAAVTDLIDGPIARATRTTSRFGSLLDKLADKALVVPIGVYQFSYIDPTLAAWSVFGAIFVTYTAISQYYQGREVPENIFGKYATVLYCLAIILPIWRETWWLARIVGWRGFWLGFASAIYNFRRYFGISDQRDS